MSDNTGIEWTDATWNPVSGCTKVSTGCDHCYAETLANRFAGTKAFPNGFGVTLRPERLDQPLRWRKSRRIFVNSMSDLFHDSVPDEYIAKVFAIMALAQRHTFQVLTKRHARMRSLLNSAQFQQAVLAEQYRQRYDDQRVTLTWPLPNVWLGVSTENQQWADNRIPALLDTPAAVRFISAEPLLGPINLEFEAYYEPDHTNCSGLVSPAHEPACGREPGKHWAIDWVIVGGESGPGARPMHPDWARSLRDQCQAAGVPFLFKQWGEYRPADSRDDVRDMTCVQAATGYFVHHGQEPPTQEPGGWVAMRRVGKKRAGRLLDGRTWDEFPREVSQ